MVRSCRQQKQAGEQQQSRKEFPHRTFKGRETCTSQSSTFLTKLFGIGLFQIRAHSVDIGDSLIGSHSRLQMSDRLKNPMGVPPLVQDILAAHLLLVDDWHKKIGRDK